MEFRRARAATVVMLEHSDLALARGEFLSVLGPSGCGKSTLLRLAAGLELPTSGEVTYDGVPIEGPSRRRGFVFQSCNVFPWLTVRNNVAFGLNNDDGGALDERTREGMRQLLLGAVRETGCSVIFVTHDIGEAILLSDRLVLLSSRPGRLLSTYKVAAQKPRSRSFLRSEAFAHLHAALLDQFPEG
jgi:ABC-type nitrate/sulfonate/bicarbonate transport system ATPase subunit